MWEQFLTRILLRGAWKQGQILPHHSDVSVGVDKLTVQYYNGSWNWLNFIERRTKAPPRVLFRCEHPCQWAIKLVWFDYGTVTPQTIEPYKWPIVPPKPQVSIDMCALVVSRRLPCPCATWMDEWDVHLAGNNHVARRSEHVSILCSLNSALRKVVQVEWLVAATNIYIRNYDCTFIIISVFTFWFMKCVTEAIHLFNFEHIK